MGEVDVDDDSWMGVLFPDETPECVSAEEDKEAECTSYKLDVGDGIIAELEQGGKELGCKAWTAALMLCAVIRENRSLVNNRDVLEIGSGLGLVGFTCASSGAKRTTIADCGPATLMLLATNLVHYQSALRQQEGLNAPMKSISKWNCGNIALRRHLWEEDEEYTAARDEQRPMDRIRHWSNVGVHDAEKTVESSMFAPTLAFEETFDVIVGSGLLYFSSQERPLLTALHLRLRANGTALILQIMRTNNELLFARFMTAAEKMFDVQCTDISPEELPGHCHAAEITHTLGYKLLRLTHCGGTTC